MNVTERYLDLAERVFNPSGQTDETRRLLLGAGASGLLLALVGCGQEEAKIPTPKNVFVEPDPKALDRLLSEVSIPGASELTPRQSIGFRPADGIRTDVFNLTQQRIIDSQLLLQLYNWIIKLAESRPTYDYIYLSPGNKQISEKLQIEPLVCAARALVVLPRELIKGSEIPTSATLIPRDRAKQKNATAYSVVFVPDEPSNPNTEFETSARAHLITEIAQSLINAQLGTIGPSSTDYDVPAEAANNGLATAIEYKVGGKSRPEYLEHISRSRSLGGGRQMFDLMYPDAIRERIPLEFVNLILRQHLSLNV